MSFVCCPNAPQKRTTMLPVDFMILVCQLQWTDGLFPMTCPPSMRCIPIASCSIPSSLPRFVHISQYLNRLVHMTAQAVAWGGPHLTMSHFGAVPAPSRGPFHMCVRRPVLVVLVGVTEEMSKRCELKRHGHGRP